jgi:hypothetical protein
MIVLNLSRNPAVRSRPSWFHFLFLLAGWLAMVTQAADRAATNTPGAIPWKEIGAKAGADYKGDGLGMVPTQTGARLHCVFQRLDGEVTPEGLWLTSTVTNTANDHFRVKAMCVGRKAANATLNSHYPESSDPLPSAGEVSVDGQTVLFSRAGLREEYSVSMNGVRQDFILSQAPSRPSAGDVVVELAVAGARAEPVAYGVRLVLENSGRKIAYTRLRVTDATGKELPSRIEVSPVGNEAAGFQSWSDPGNFLTELNPLTPTATDVKLAVMVNDANAVYPVRIDPTFSDANWISMGGLPGTDGEVDAAVIDGSGNLYIGGQFSVVSGIAANNVAEWNGTNWSALDSGVSGANLYGEGPGVYALVASGSKLYVGGQFTTAGSSVANNLAEWNGGTWSAALGSGLNGAVNALAVSGTTLYAGGEFTTAGNDTNASFIAQWNGSNWSSLGSGISAPDLYGVDLEVNALAVSGGTLYAGGLFTTAGGVAANSIAQWDGTNWSALGSGIGDIEYSYVDALAVSGSTLYAGGGFTTAGGVAVNSIAQWDGTNWSALGSGIDNTVSALAVFGGTLYAGCALWADAAIVTNYVAEWNGSNWLKLSSGINGQLRALAASGTTLYAGGDFTTAGSTAANYIGQWNGSTWSAAPGSGLNGAVEALAVSGDTLYAGGDFTSAGGSVANYVAQWNGSSWSPLGSGMNNTVAALAVFGNTLYAGGAFTTAGGLTANCIAQWNGSSWSALGSGLSGQGFDGGLYVDALAVLDGRLYAGGDFTTAGDDTNASYIAQWNGSSWSALGSGIGGVSGGTTGVFCLTVSEGTLYVGGAFEVAGGTGAGSLAQWNGSQWSGLYTDGIVYALAASGSTLYVGGNFSRAGVVPVNRIAKWNGSSWSALGSGPGTGSVSALALSGGTLYAGTSLFGAVEGPVQLPIEQWDGSSWSALGSGMNGNVSALVVSGDTLYAGGSFTTAGTNVSPYAAEAVLGSAASYYEISLSPSPSADGTVSGGGTFASGSSQTVTATANSGFTFANWTENGTVVSSSASYTFTISANLNLVANFTLSNPPSSGLVLLTNGYGTIQHGTWPKNLVIGKTYTVTAVPRPGNLFSSWVGGTAPPFSVLSASASYTFTMQDGLELEANFVTNPFISQQGVFNGLYLDTNNVTEASSGFFTLNLMTSGAFTGKIMTSGSTYILPTTAKFDVGGQVEFTIPTKVNTLTFNLQLDISDPASQQITGTVSGGDWTAGLTADRAVFSTSENKAMNFEGQYTLAIAGSEDGATSPSGFGCATLSINSAGLIAMAGNLADGTSINQSVSTSKDGRWPFYASYTKPPVGNGGAAFGWITFSNEPASALGGTMYWFRPAGKTPTVYQSGFTNMASIVGSAYIPTEKPLLALSGGQVTLDGGNLPFSITNQITLSANDTITVPHTAENTNKLALTINKTTGAISGSFANPSNPKKTITVKGVLLQNQTNAVGYFLGTNYSGAFLLENP